MTVGAFNFFKKNNILYLYIYITNLIIKHKRNVAQLVRALIFKHKGWGSNPLLFLSLKAILAYLKKKPAAQQGPNIFPRPGPPLETRIEEERMLQPVLPLTG